MSNQDVFGFALIFLASNIFVATTTSRATYNCKSQIQSVVVDNKSGMVYVGVTNKLIQLDRDLKIVATVETGPRWDSPNCPPPPTEECHCSGSSCSDFEKMNMDSVSKSLIIDYKGNRVIGCTNLYQGHCIKYNLTNIGQTDGQIYPMIVPNDEKSSIIMYIAPGLFSNGGSYSNAHQTTDVLYIAASRSTKGMPAYKDNVPTISVRNLKNLTFISDDMLTPSRIETEVQQRDVFKVTYKYGFPSLRFSYFLSIQKPSAISDSDRLVTRISRICQADRSLYSYTELSLECYGATTNPGSLGRHYNVLKAAIVTHAGPHLATRLGLAHLPPLSDNEHILFAVFSHVNESGGAGQGGGSALCVYPMTMVRRLFTETIQRCFQGIGNTGPDHFVQPIPCVSAKFEITDDYCGQHDINHPIKGTDPVSASATHIWPRDDVTSISVATINNATVALLGTSNGHVKKVRIDNETYAHEYAEEVIDSRYSVLQNTHLDTQHEYLYAGIGSTLYKLSLETCSQYTTCTECLAPIDPHCGWCNTHQKCTKKKKVPTATLR